MRLMWFNRPSNYFIKFPDLLSDRGAVSLFLIELEDLEHTLLLSDDYQRSNLILAEIETEIQWLKQNRMDNNNIT